MKGSNLDKVCINSEHPPMQYSKWLQNAPSYPVLCSFLAFRCLSGVKVLSPQKVLSFKQSRSTVLSHIFNFLIINIHDRRSPVS